LLLLVLALFIPFMAACDEEETKTIVDNPDTPWVETEYSLMPAQNCDVLRARIINATTEEILNSRYSQGGRFMADAENGGNVPAPSADPSSPTDYTTTNVQEAGVDEIDLVKTDGNFLYTVVQGDLVIVDSWPVTEVSEVSRVQLTEQPDYSYSSGLFLFGDRVVVVNNTWASGTNTVRPFDGTRFTIIDVTDRTAPVVERIVDVEGWFADARMLDGEVYAVTNSYLNLPFNVWEYGWNELPGVSSPEYSDDEARTAALKNQARPQIHTLVANQLAGVDVQSLLPRKFENNVSAPLFSCTDVYLPQTVAQLGMLSLTHFSLDDPAVFDATGLLAQGWEVYASQDNLYIAMGSNWWWWGWGSGNLETHIHKFGLRGPNGKPAYVASGRVDGWLLNQFAMSEYQGYLRVATTDNDWEWNATTSTSTVTGGNAITVLQQDGGLLNKVGELTGLAPGEQIYAVRMMAERGFMVTFRQAGPLFTIDLTDPTAPTLKGELKVNGFSSYLHPLGADHLLTIGQDATDDGAVTGVQLQIFDVTDMTNPTRDFQEVVSFGSWSSYSEAMWDHHAFTYHAEKQILAFPINIYEWDNANGENFSGLLIYKASDATGFEEIGRVNHADLVNQQWCHDNYDVWTCDPDYGYSWWTTVRRSVFIEDYVYSLSDVGLKVNGLLTPEDQYAGILLRQ